MEVGVGGEGGCSSTLQHHQPPSCPFCFVVMTSLPAAIGCQPGAGRVCSVFWQWECFRCRPGARGDLECFLCADWAEHPTRRF